METTRLKQLDAVSAASLCPLEKGGCDPITRREAVRRVGGWVIFLGALGASALGAESCGPATPSSEGATSSPTPDQSATPTATDSPTPTPTGTSTASGSPTPTGTPSSACGCGVNPSGTAWHNTSLKASQVPLNAVAYNATSQVFICHDAQGFYCMDSLCPHQGCDMGTKSATGSTWSATNLNGGFYCGCHGSTFNANGVAQPGSATSNPIPHYLLSTDSSGNFWVDYNTAAAATCRC